MNISKLTTSVGGVLGPLCGVAIAWMDEMTLPLSGFVVVGGETEPLHPASISVMATVVTTAILRTLDLSDIAGLPVFPTVGRGPELVPESDPVSDSRVDKAEVTLARLRACETFPVTNNSPPGHPVIGRGLD